MPGNQNLFMAFTNAFHGLHYVFSSQRNAKIHAIITILVVLISYLLKISESEWIAIIFAIGLVWSAECLNTAIEKLTDLVSPNFHTLAKISKDSAAAGVLFASVTALV